MADRKFGPVFDSLSHVNEIYIFAAFIALNRANKAFPWKSYLDTLPASLPHQYTLPEDALQLLEGSSVG